MNVFKRIGLFLLGIAGCISLIALTLPWFGPWKNAAAGLLSIEWYRYLVEGAVAITGLGSLLSLGRAVLTPHNAKTVTVSKSSGDQVTITTSAISSQASHIIEADGDYVAEKVWVNARGNGKVRVSARVRPAYAVDITTEGKRLHDELVDGLSTLCGNSVGRIKLEFVEADSLDSKPEYYSEPPALEPPDSTELQPAESVPVPESGITVPISWASTSSEQLETNSANDEDL